MNYICNFCKNKFSSSEVEIICPVCGEDYFIEKVDDKNVFKLKKSDKGEKK